MGWIITEYIDGICHVTPEGEEHNLDAWWENGEVLCRCACQPHPEGGQNGGIIVVHSSFDGREYVERAQAIIDGK